VKLWPKVWCLVFLTHGVESQDALGDLAHDDPGTPPPGGGSYKKDSIASTLSSSRRIQRSTVDIDS